MEAVPDAAPLSAEEGAEAGERKRTRDGEATLRLDPGGIEGAMKVRLDEGLKDEIRAEEEGGIPFLFVWKLASVECLN